MISINELFNSWINWTDAREVVLDDSRSDCCDVLKENRSTAEELWFAKGRASALYVVTKAVRSGLLPNLKKSFVKCSDCAERAECYEHRDYLLPLDVTPVCGPCNAKRGPADFMPPPQRDE